jgi:N-acetylmuramoyl-L-alanine amidase
MIKRGWCYRLFILIAAGLGLGLKPLPPDRVAQTQQALSEMRNDIAVKWVREERLGELNVCLTVPYDLLAEQQWVGMEKILESVRRAMTPISWSSLVVQRWDPEQKICRPISDFAPDPDPISGRSTSQQRETEPPIVPSHQTRMAETFPNALVGKTVYVSAGHGWLWNGSRWVTQRIPYETMIEDHNNAEAVDQYLIPYLENAGATVISMRERDWNASRVIVDNDEGPPTFETSGVWYTTSYQGTGYNGTDYQYALTEGPTSVCTWTLTVPDKGTYALYAWVRPGPNRAPDAHYVVHHAAGTDEVWLNQQIRGSTWRYLGSYPFYAGTAYVTLDSGSLSSSKVVIADAIRLGGGTLDSLDNLSDPDFTPSTPIPDHPWWEVATYYYSQWMGYEPGSYFNDVVSRPMFARWNHAGSREDAVYISWHSNGFLGTTRGTESYVHSGETYPRTEGSIELQQFVHQELIQDIRTGWDATWVNRGAKQMNLGELRMLYDSDPDDGDPDAGLPGVLVEIAFHDHPEDAAALKNPRFNQLAARATYQGIVKYFEDRDGRNLTLAPEPPTHLRVENIGSGTVRVSWEPSLTDAIDLGGDAATAYRIHTSPDGFAWGAPVTVIGNHYDITRLDEGATVYVRVTAINDGGESFPTEVLGARVGEPGLLIVNGFDKLNQFGLVYEDDPEMGVNERMWTAQMNSFAYAVIHGDSVPVSYAYGWDSASNEAIVSDLVDLTRYASVDWILGEESIDDDGTLSDAERVRIKTYLDQGGGLLISGSEMAWDLEAMGRDPDFLHTVLRTDYVSDDAETLTAQPVAGGIFEGLGPISFDAADEYFVDYPDVIAPLNGGRAALSYVGGIGGAAAVQASGSAGDGCERVIVMGFPFETITPSSRTPLMRAALDYLGACGPLGVQIVSPVDSAYYQAPPEFTGIAFGESLLNVETQLMRTDDGYYWNGSSWGAIGIWLTATGTTTWSYAMPSPLSDGTYTAQARAVGEEQDSESIEVTFTLDTTPPLTPTVITPTGGITLRELPIVLEWEPVIDSGAPIAYEVELDGVVRATNEVTYTSNLRSGAHQWRVRAYDLAGNTGPFTNLQGFNIDLEEIFLPLVLKLTP